VRSQYIFSFMTVLIDDPGLVYRRQTRSLPLFSKPFLLGQTPI
jgi:hypothetical protein